MGIKMAYIQIFIWGKWKNKFQTSSYNQTLLLRFIDDIDTKLTKRQKSNSMISNLVSMMRFWNNLRPVHSNSKYWKESKRLWEEGS